MSKYGHRPHNWFEAIVNKLGGEERADAFLRGELSVSGPIRSWREEDGVIYFSVTSDGTTGEGWIKRLSGNGFLIGSRAKQVLRSPGFKPTCGVTTKIAALKSVLFEGGKRSIDYIRTEAENRKFSKPNAEVACLVRSKFSDEDITNMGLNWFSIQHDPIVVENTPWTLGLGRASGASSLDVDYANSELINSAGCAAVFVVSQKPFGYDDF